LDFNVKEKFFLEVKITLKLIETIFPPKKGSEPKLSFEGDCFF